MKINNLRALGYSQELETYRKTNFHNDFIVGRVIRQNRDRYKVATQEGELEAEPIGNLRYAISDKSQLPAVGDWVSVMVYDDAKGLIHGVFPRKTLLHRQRAGKANETQVVAANIDVGLIIQSVNRDFNLNRIERYLTICNSSGIKPAVLLSKIDLISTEEVQTRITQLRGRFRNIDIEVFSSVTGQGMDTVKGMIKPGITYCLLGSSGVGKSTLANHMLGRDEMFTRSISESIDRGKHTTTHRELMVLPNGGILIDNPGMREVGMAQHSDGLEATFDQIYELMETCAFKNCKHEGDKGCAIQEAIDTGRLTQETYINFKRLEREQQHYEESIAHRRAKEKRFGKQIKQIMQEKNKGRYED